jgi:hypothetical protein
MKIYKHFSELSVTEQDVQIKKLSEQSGCSIYVATAKLLKLNFLYLYDGSEMHYQCVMADEYSDLVKSMIG